MQPMRKLVYADNFIPSLSLTITHFKLAYYFLLIVNMTEFSKCLLQMRKPTVTNLIKFHYITTNEITSFLKMQGLF